MDGPAIVATGGVEVAPPVVDGRYEIRAQIGRGGFGVVYAAVDVDLLHEVALKMATEEWLRDEKASAALLAEARALASVRSQHVVRVLSFGRHRGGLYFAMERVRGKSLAELLQAQAREGRRLPLAQSLRILEQIGAGLTAVHAAGVLHLDVKPANVMIEDQTGRPVLIDFGIAARASDQPQVIGGTPGYMSPEQGGLTEDPITARADVYGLAATFFEVLTGSAPFGPGPAPAIFGAQLCRMPRLSRRRPDLAHLDPVFTRALALHVENRHESCAEFVSDLTTRAQSALPGAGERASAPPDARQSSPEPRPAPDALVVLVVNPDPASARVCSSAARIALFGKRLIVEQAVDAREALALTGQPPDLLVLHDDAGEDALDLVLSLRAAPSGSGLRVLVLSGAEALPASQARFASLGVKHFLPAPASLHALVDTLGSIADRAGWRDRRGQPTGSDEDAS